VKPKKVIKVQNQFMSPYNKIAALCPALIHTELHILTEFKKEKTTHIKLRQHQQAFSFLISLRISLRYIHFIQTKIFPCSSFKFVSPSYLFIFIHLPRLPENFHCGASAPAGTTGFTLIKRQSLFFLMFFITCYLFGVDNRTL
jgi:hypothetical protein